jgi:tetratricopeptide (TPR) repeat protein
MLPDTYKIAMLVPVENALSAYQSNLLPFRPNTLFSVLDAYLPYIEYLPSKALGEWICREFNMTPRMVGAIAIFLVKSLQHIGDHDRERSEIRLKLMHHFLYSAALLGDPAAVVLHYQLLDGIAKNNRSKVEAAEIYEAYGRLRETARAGHPSSLAVMAVALEERGMKREALESYLKCGEAGDGNGYAYGGRLLNNVLGNKEEAIRVWRKGAVELDNARCYYDLALALGPDHLEFEKFMIKAAASGIKGAAHNLGVFYATREVAMAKEWFAIGAGEGLVESVFSLKTLLEKERKAEELEEWVGEEMIEMANNTVRKRPKTKKVKVKTMEPKKE